MLILRFFASLFGLVSAIFWAVFATVGYVVGSAREGFSLGYSWGAADALKALRLTEQEAD